MVKEGSSCAEILEIMKSPMSGVGFLSQQPSLPGYTFVSADAIQWLLTHVEGVTSHQHALNIMQNMLKEKLICHASGNFSKEFIVGFYLYFIVSANKDEPKGDSDIGSMWEVAGFDNEWVEVEVQPTNETSDVPLFLANALPPPQCPRVDLKRPSYKEAHLDIDVQNKSDRTEWGHVSYQAVYQVDKAYEMIVQWVAASGTIVADLVFGWARKAQTCGLQMIPVPADPFAIPGSPKSDPLRGPIFIPLDTECLMATKSYLFEEFEEETWAQRLDLFQDSIAVTFGFIPCPIENTHSRNQYVHVSGNVFLRIRSIGCEEEWCERSGGGGGVSRSKPHQMVQTESRWSGGGGGETSLQHICPVASPPPHHHRYIANSANTLHHHIDNRVGFLWSWNHIVSRRWKLGSTNATCDELFQNKLLADFKEFCSNGNNRLKVYWDTAWAKLKHASEDSS